VIVVLAGVRMIIVIKQPEGLEWNLKSSKSKILNLGKMCPEKRG